MIKNKSIDSEVVQPQRTVDPLALKRALGKACDMVAVLLFACVFLVFAFKIVMRYVADNPVPWADEVAVVLFVWLLFWGNSFIVDEIRFDLLYRLLPETWRRAAMLLRLVIIGGLFLWALPSVIDYILFLKRERTPVLELRLDLVYACFGLFSLVLVIRTARHIFGLIRMSWRSHI